MVGTGCRCGRIAADSVQENRKGVTKVAGKGRGGQGDSGASLGTGEATDGKGTTDGTTVALG